MRKVWFGVLFLSLLSTVNPVFSEGKPKTSGEMDEAFVAAEKTRLQDAYKKTIETLNKDFTDQQTLESNLKENRLVFEKQNVNERIGFLDGLKAMDPKARKQAWINFNQQQDLKKKEFLDLQQAQRRKFQRPQEPARPPVMTNKPTPAAPK